MKDHLSLYIYILLPERPAGQRLRKTKSTLGSDTRGDPSRHKCDQGHLEVVASLGDFNIFAANAPKRDVDRHLELNDDDNDYDNDDDHDTVIVDVPVCHQ